MSTQLVRPRAGVEGGATRTGSLRGANSSGGNRFTPGKKNRQSTADRKKDICRERAGVRQTGIPKGGWVGKGRSRNEKC